MYAFYTGKSDLLKKILRPIAGGGKAAFESVTGRNKNLLNAWFNFMSTDFENIAE